MIRWLTTWALLTVVGVALAWLFCGYGLDQFERMEQYKPPWSKPGYMEREFGPYQFDFASGRVKTSGHGYYDRKRERGR